MIMTLISELCSPMLEILSFQNWDQNMQICYTPILKDGLMSMHCVHQRKVIIRSVIIFGSLRFVPKEMVVG